METLTIQNYKNKSFYIRSSSIESNKLSNLIARRYSTSSRLRNDKTCILANSGMHATNGILQSICINYKWDSNINIIYADELYCDTYRLFKHIQSLYTPINLYEFSDNVVEIFSKLKGQTNILFLESCSNPTGKIFDFNIIPQLRKLSKELIIIVDNTWLTDVIFNPFFHHIDFVVTSLSKYYSGGNCIAGAIIGNNENMEYNNIDQQKRKALLCKILSINWQKFKNEGIHINPIYCNIIIKNMKLMNKRICHTSKTTVNIAKYLQDKKKIHSVKHPYLTCHQDHKLSKIYFKNKLYPSVISFQLKMTRKEATELMTNSNIKIETSFGGPDTIFDYWSFFKDGVTSCRLSIGYNDNMDDIVAKLDKIF